MAGGIQRKRLRTWTLPGKQLPEPLLVLGIAFLLGVAAGSWAAWQLGEGSTQALRNYLDGYLAVVQEQTTPAAWGELLWRTVRLPLCAVLLGLCPLGLIGLPALVCIRGFLFSFVVSACGHCAGAEGILAAFLLFGLSQAVSTAALLLISLSGWSYARDLALEQSRRKKDTQIKQYLLWCLCCTAAAALAAVLCRFVSGFAAPLAAEWLMG